MRLPLVCLWFVVAALLPACEPRVCCALPPPAVLVSVVDSEDRLIRDAVVTYVDETPPREPSREPSIPEAPVEEKAWCRTWAKKDAGCEVWAIGTFDGVFRVRAVSADGTRRVEEVISIEAPSTFDEDSIAKRRLVLPD